MQLKYDEIKKQAIPNLILSRPDGYYGKRAIIQKHIRELYPCAIVEEIDEDCGKWHEDSLMGITVTLSEE